MRIGFAGLGRMGLPMARNLSGAGSDLTVWNRMDGKVLALAEEVGCRVAPAPARLRKAPMW